MKPLTPEQARIGALSRFAIAITILNLLGHTILGFEVSVLQTVVCALTAYTVELVLETVGAWSENRKPRFLGGGLREFVIFLLPAHITGLATSMFLYAGDRLLPFVFAVAVAMTSKAIFTVTSDGRQRHFLNPSNTGLVVTFALFPTVGMIPYHFTADLHGYGDWVLPALILCTGTFLNTRFTKKMPLIEAWVIAYVLQAVIRHFLFGTSLPASLAQMTGVAFLLFTFYMITDPQTSPSSVRGQILFGASIGAVYGVFMALHLVYTIFGALLTVCIVRGIILHVGKFVAVRNAQAWIRRFWLGLFGRPTSPIIP
jgi:hypothetical protein